MNTLDKCLYKLTHCDTGAHLNPLMHVFLYVTLMFSLGILLGDPSVMATALYQETAKVGIGALNLWGAVGIITVICHSVGLIWRGRYGIQLMRIAMFGGFYMWLWAGVIYLTGGYTFQFLVAAVPNLLFWGWYAWQWRKRYKNLGSTCVSAFV